jgi:hypothetical protein
MSSVSVDNNWILDDAIRSSLRQTRGSQKQGSAYVAKENSSLQTITDLQKIEKDVILVANPGERQANVRAGVTSSAAGKPQLPPPGLNWNALQGVGAPEQGLIAIIGSVLCLQAKTNSNFWSTLWKQASQSMMMEVKFAPIIGDAINAAYQAQAAATQSQAEQSRTDGIISLCMFGGSMVMAAYMEGTDEENPLNQDDESIADVNKTAQANNAPANNLETAQNNVNNEATQADNKASEAWEQRAKRYWNKFKQGMSRGQKRVTSYLGNAMKMTMMFSMLNDGVTKLNDAKYQAQQASYQSQEGGCQALSKESEQYAQFYGQDFSREEDLRQGNQQNIDYAMNILKSAADSITQTITAMFRG